MTVAAKKGPKYKLQDSTCEPCVSYVFPFLLLQTTSHSWKKRCHTTIEGMIKKPLGWWFQDCQPPSFFFWWNLVRTWKLRSHQTVNRLSFHKTLKTPKIWDLPPKAEKIKKQRNLPAKPRFCVFLFHANTILKTSFLYGLVINYINISQLSHQWLVAWQLLRLLQLSCPSLFEPSWWELIYQKWSYQP